MRKAATPLGAIAPMSVSAMARSAPWTTLPIKLARNTHPQLVRTAVLTNWGWVFLANLIGSVVHGALLAIALTDMGAIAPNGVAAFIIKVAETKTTGYAAFGAAGMVTVFVKAILCNWMVCLAVVLAMSTNSTLGKIVTAYMPILVFFAQGFEHSVVNMFIIPTGMMLGAKVTLAD